MRYYLLSEEIFNEILDSEDGDYIIKVSGCGYETCWLVEAFMICLLSFAVEIA